ncbi:unnamed protein product, partial [Prorocentrum cordatum]
RVCVCVCDCRKLATLQSGSGCAVVVSSSEEAYQARCRSAFHPGSRPASAPSSVRPASAPSPMDLLKAQLALRAQRPQAPAKPAADAAEAALGGAVAAAAPSADAPATPPASSPKPQAPLPRPVTAGKRSGDLASGGSFLPSDACHLVGAACFLELEQPPSAPAAAALQPATAEPSSRAARPGTAEQLRP